MSTRSKLAILPEDVLGVSLANAFLGDADAVALSTSASWVLRTLQPRYFVRKHLRVDQVEHSLRLAGRVRRVEIYKVRDFVHPLVAGATHLHLGSSFNHPIEDVQLPASLHTLHLGYHFDHPIEQLKLPASLYMLRLGVDFNQPIEQLKLPASLHTLHLGSWFNHPIEQLKLPASLHMLDLGYYFNHPIEQLKLHASLHALYLGAKFNQPIEQLKLPASLHTMDLGSVFEHPICKLPVLLRMLSLPRHWGPAIPTMQLPVTVNVCLGI